MAEWKWTEWIAHDDQGRPNGFTTEQLCTGDLEVEGRRGGGRAGGGVGRERGGHGCQRGARRREKKDTDVTS